LNCNDNENRSFASIVREDSMNYLMGLWWRIYKRRVDIDTKWWFQLTVLLFNYFILQCSPWSYVKMISCRCSHGQFHTEFSYIIFHLPKMPDSPKSEKKTFPLNYGKLCGKKLKKKVWQKKLIIYFYNFLSAPNLH
jgi:hypothetical protein